MVLANLGEMKSPEKNVKLKKNSIEFLALLSAKLQENGPAADAFDSNVEKSDFVSAAREHHGT